MKTNGEKHVTGHERGKAFNRYQARENMRPLPSAGKFATSAQHCPAREISVSHD